MWIKARLPRCRARPGGFGRVAGAWSRARLAGGGRFRYGCGPNARSELWCRQVAALTRGRARGERTVRWPRGVVGRADQQVTVGATSSHAVGLSCVAALTRAACRSNVGSLPGGARLSGGRTFELWAWSNSQGQGMRIQGSQNRRLTMQSTRRRNRPFAQTGQYCRRALLRR